MQRVRVRYTKEGRVRYISARDLTSVWERGLRRASLPIAYSEGFSPHPKVSFPDALPLGFASTGEYAELTFAAPIDPGTGLARLSATLPIGMDITTYVNVPEGARKLASQLKATLWEFEGAPTDDPSARAAATELEHRAAMLLAAEHAEVIRRRPKGDKTIDVRPTVIALAATLRPTGEQVVPVLRAVLRNDGPTIRPNDLHSAMSALSAEPLPEPRLYRRIAQGEAVEDGLQEALTQQIVPLSPDRSAEAA